MTLRRRFKRWLYGSCPGFAGRFPYYGIQVYFPPKSESFYAACQQGIFEADIVRLMQKLARPGTHVFDVGGNIGLMAAPVLQACSTCTVVSFEPSPNSLPYLRRTVSEGGCGERWVVVGRALSDVAGELDFAVGDAKDSLYEGFRSADRIPSAHMVKVPVSTLDIEWGHLGRPNVSVMKIDVEGAEKLVLDGGRELIDACRPHLIIEWVEQYLKSFGTPAYDLLGFAQSTGYGIYAIPHGVPVTDAKSLRVQMLKCSNFLLAP